MTEPIWWLSIIIIIIMVVKPHSTDLYSKYMSLHPVWYLTMLLSMTVDPLSPARGHRSSRLSGSEDLLKMKVTGLAASRHFQGVATKALRSFCPLTYKQYSWHQAISQAFIYFWEKVTKRHVTERFSPQNFESIFYKCTPAQTTTCYRSLVTHESFGTKM